MSVFLIIIQMSLSRGLQKSISRSTFKIFERALVMGIHYDYKSTKGNKLMEKQAKRERKLAEKKAKRLAKEGPKKEEPTSKPLDPNKPISLDFLTNPNKE